MRSGFEMLGAYNSHFCLGKYLDAYGIKRGRYEPYSLDSFLT
jgi:hypothetical protein